jgi:hypothetical protein
MNVRKRRSCDERQGRRCPLLRLRGVKKVDSGIKTKMSGSNIRISRCSGSPVVFLNLVLSRFRGRAEVGRRKRQRKILEGLNYFEKPMDVSVERKLREWSLR